MVAKQVLVLVCILLASNGICYVEGEKETGHFIEFTESDEISLNKLSRSLEDFMGDDEYSIAHNVVKELARTMDKTELKAIAGKYSVYELLDINTYWLKGLRYCSQFEVETRQRRCDHLANDDKHKNLLHYCLYCASQYFEICRGNIPGMLSMNILEKNHIPALMLKNIELLVKNFKAWILRDGYENKSDSFNFNEFIRDPKNLPTSWDSIKKTCMSVLDNFADVLYFDSEAKLSVEYLKEKLPEEHKDKVIVGYCGTFIKVIEPKMSQHQLLRDDV